LLLTVYPSSGSGKGVMYEEVLIEIEKNRYKDVNLRSVEIAVKQALGKPVKVGPYQEIPELDPVYELDILGDGVKAILTIKPPKIGGRPVTFEGVMSFLHKREVVAGIKEKAIKEVIEHQRFHIPFVAAEEIPPSPGEDAKIEYKFETDKTKIKLVEDEHGRIDFKRLNLIENVTKGQVVAIKIPAKFGKPGMTVTGKEIPPIMGADVKLPVGKNTEPAEDGNVLIASRDGHVMLSGEKVNVEPIYEIGGDVNLEVGNIYFLGTVIIKGDVADDFEVEAKGDIQVYGGVGKAKLSAGGTISIGEGIKGHGEALIKAKGDVIAKFIENATVEAQGNVIVSDAIMNSHINAGKKVILQGQRWGAIIGGIVRAGSGVEAKEVGCGALTPTVIEVGGPPKAREQLLKLEEAYKGDIREFERVKLDIKGIREFQKQHGYLPRAKEKKLAELLRTQERLMKRLRRYNEQKSLLEAKILHSKNESVIVEEMIYPGTRIDLRTDGIDVKDPIKSVILSFVGGKIKSRPYKKEEAQEE
jgi:hypothetical protein